MNNPLNSFLIENFWNYGNPIFCRACYKTLILIFWKPIYRVNSHVGGIRYCVRWRVVTVKTISFNLSYSDLILKFNQEWPWRSFIRNFTAELTLRYLFCLTKGISAIILNFRSINAHFNQKKNSLLLIKKINYLPYFIKYIRLKVCNILHLLSYTNINNLCLNIHLNYDQVFLPEIDQEH